MAWREQLEIGELTVGKMAFRESGAAEQGAIFDLPIGIAGKVIETGDYSSTAGNAVELDSSNTRPNSFLGDDGGSAATGNIRNLLSRVLVTANHTGALTLEAIRGQVKFADGVDYDADYAAGVCGYLEIAGATDFNLNNDDHSACALRARVEAAGNVSVEQGYLAGVYVELNTTGAYSFTTDADGILAGMVFITTDQKNDAWDHGIYFANSAADTAITINNATTGIDIAGTVATGINIDGTHTKGISLSGSGFTQGFYADITGEGYSLNLISVTSTCTAGEGTRGWRVNATTSASIASGDLQCVHGYLTLGSGASLANNAAVYPLSAWIDIPDTTTVGTGTVVAGVRAIFDPNNNALGSGTAGCESAIFYGQTWASTGTIDAGLFIAAGAGSTIDSMIELGGTGTVGTIIDLTSWGKDTTLVLVKGGPKDTTETAHWVFAVGDADSHADIVSALGGTSYGSLFMSTTGAIWVNKAGTWTDCTA